LLTCFAVLKEGPLGYFSVPNSLIESRNLVLNFICKLLQAEAFRRQYPARNPPSL